MLPTTGFLWNSISVLSISYFYKYPCTRVSLIMDVWGGLIKDIVFNFIPSIFNCFLVSFLPFSDFRVHRLNEAVMHFGESIKDIINEEFGDGM